MITLNNSTISGFWVKQRNKQTNKQKQSKESIGYRQYTANWKLPGRSISEISVGSVVEGLALIEH